MYIKMDTVEMYFVEKLGTILLLFLIPLPVLQNNVLPKAYKKKYYTYF